MRVEGTITSFRRAPVVALGVLLTPFAYAFPVGTGGDATFTYLQHRGAKGYALAVYDTASSITHAERTAAEDLDRIRAVLQPTVADLAKMVGVSRQAVYDWHAGKPITEHNAARLQDLGKAADVLAVEGLAGSARALRRPLSGGRSFLEIVQAGSSAENAARMLIELLRKEEKQRTALQSRLSGRAAPPDLHDELGVPMLREDA